VSHDAGGLLSILEQHGAELFALLCRLTLRADVAEDLLQDLFLKLRSSAGFARAANRKAYVFQTAIHLAFDWRRGQRATERLPIDQVGAIDATLDRMIDAEDIREVLDAMERLSPLGRQVLVLHYLQHQDYAEIAGQLGKSEHQVRGLCHKALGQLRSILPPAAGEPETRGLRP
jgi:RNA polymerase sigma-70 factor (ECF subfamily)